VPLFPPVFIGSQDLFFLDINWNYRIFLFIAFFVTWFIR
jgi:hypothetical protein